MERSKQEYYKDYYMKNKERIADLNKARYERVRSTPEGIKRHRAKATEATRRYRLNNPDKVLLTRKSVYLNRKVRAMEMVGGAKCKRCGCTELSFLEFNHKDGGGCKEWKNTSASIADRILSGKRSLEGLEVLCRVCNALDFLERKNNELSKKYKIIWN